jgi:hypothetical protein
MNIVNTTLTTIYSKVSTYTACVILIHTYMHFFVNRYILYIETSRPNTSRHVQAHKCLHCAGIEPATSCVVGEYSNHYAKSAVKLAFLIFLALTTLASCATLANPYLDFQCSL